MNIVFRGKYAKLVNAQHKKEKGWLYEAYVIIYRYYESSEFTTLVSPKLRGEHPVYCYINTKFIFIDPDAGYKEDYVDKSLNTISRWHCANIKKANISQKQKRIMDFVLGVAHEVGHIKADHHMINIDNKDDYSYQQKEIEAEQEVYRVAAYNKWLDIIEPEEPAQRFKQDKGFITKRYG